jgi:hypothetical protein
METDVLHCYTNVLHCYAGLAFASRLWKWLANSPPIYRTVLGTVLDM